MNNLVNANLQNFVVYFSSETLDINDITFYFTKIQRTNAPIVLTATPQNGVSITNFRWEIRKMEDDTLVGISLDQNASIPAVTECGWYYITFKGSNSIDQYFRRWDDIFVFYPKFTEAEADIVVDFTTLGYFNNGGGADYSGYKIYVKGSGSGGGNGMWLYHMFGNSGSSTSSKYENYIRVQKEIGNNNINQESPGAYDQMTFSACRYVILDGYNDNGTRGWNLNSNATTLFECRISDNNIAPTNIHMMGVNLTRNGASNDTTMIRWEVPPGSAINNATSHSCNDMVIYDCKLSGSGAEGMYLAYTNDSPQSGYTPIKFRNPIIAYNDILNSGNDAIQPCSCVNIRCHDNNIITWGVQTNQFHENAFSWNAGNSGRCYNNYAINGKVGFNAQSGLYPYDIYGGETSPAKLSVYNNVFIEGTPPSGGAREDIFIYGQVNNSSTSSEWPVEFFNNTIICDKNLMGWNFVASGYTIPNFKFINNICVLKSGSGGDYPELDFFGTPIPTSPIVHNLLRSASNYSSILFNNTSSATSSEGYKISNLLSPVYSGALNLSLYISTSISGIQLIDKEGLPDLGSGSYTYGAYSGYNYKTITPTIEDASTASFTSGPTVGTILYNGATLSFETDKFGVLYYVVVANNSTAPSKAQVKAGLNGSGGPALAYGKIIDVGIAATQSFTGLLESTAYDLYCYFTTRDWIEQSSVTKVDFTTIADAIAPTLSGFEVLNSEPSKIYFSSSKTITGTTSGGLILDQILGTTKSISNIVINNGQLQGHYFSASSPFTAGDYAARIRYVGSGSNIQDTAVTPNTLSLFTPTTIINSITYDKRINVNITNYALVNSASWNDADFLDNYTQSRTIINNLDDNSNIPTNIAFRLENGFGGRDNGVNATGSYINVATAGARGLTVYGNSGTASNGTFQFSGSGLTPGGSFEAIYGIVTVFASGSGNVTFPTGGALNFGSPYTEYKHSGSISTAGTIDFQMNSTSSTGYSAITAIILITYP